MNIAYINDDYKIIQKIGEGSFSEVIKCENVKTGEQYAAKRLKKIFKNPAEILDCAEIVAWNKVEVHPNILYMVEYLYDHFTHKLSFIFELMDMSMYDFMKTKRRYMPESKVKNYLFQILKGLDHLHNNGLFHRDIKPENILIKFPNPSLPNQGEIVKLADFGSIRGIYSTPPYTEYISTRWYRSPECLLTIGYYGPKMDVWATGCVFYEMFKLRPLFAGANEIDQLEKIHSILGSPSPRLLFKFKNKSKNFIKFPKQPGIGLSSLLPSMSPDGQSVLKMMIQYDPDTRSNVRRVLDHNYFTALRDEGSPKLKYPSFGPDSFAKNRGDFPVSSISNTSPLKSDKYRNMPSRASIKIIKEPTKIPRRIDTFKAKTSIDVTEEKPRPKQPSPNMRSPSILKPTDVLKPKQNNVPKKNLSPPPPKAIPASNKRVPETKSPEHLSKSIKYRKISSNPPEGDNMTDNFKVGCQKQKKFYSKSLVLPRRTMGQIALAGALSFPSSISNQPGVLNKSKKNSHM